MRVPVRPLALRVAFVRRVNVELHRQPLRHEMRLGEGAGQRDPVLGGHIGVGRQRQHDLASHLCVLAPFRRFSFVPQHTGLAKPFGRALGQQDSVVLGCVAMAEVEHLAGPLGRDLLPAIVSRRTHRAAAGTTGDIAGTREFDGQATHMALFWSAASRVAPAMHIASARSRSLCSLGAEPAAAVWWARTKVR